MCLWHSLNLYFIEIKKHKKRQLVESYWYSDQHFQRKIKLFVHFSPLSPQNKLLFWTHKWKSLLNQHDVTSCPYNINYCNDLSPDCNVILLRDCLSSPHLHSQKSLPPKEKKNPKQNSSIVHMCFVSYMWDALLFLSPLSPPSGVFRSRNVPCRLKASAMPRWGKELEIGQEQGGAYQAAHELVPTARAGAPAPACFDGTVWLFRLWEIMWLSKGRSGRTPITVLWLEGLASCPTQRCNYMESRGSKRTRSSIWHREVAPSWWLKDRRQQMSYFSRHKTRSMALVFICSVRFLQMDSSVWGIWFPQGAVKLSTSLFRQGSVLQNTNRQIYYMAKQQQRTASQCYTACRW